MVTNPELNGAETTEQTTESFSDHLTMPHTTVAKKRRRASVENGTRAEENIYSNLSQERLENQISQWKRIMLLVVAITVHNIPEGTFNIH